MVVVVYVGGVQCLQVIKISPTRTLALVCLQHKTFFAFFSCLALEEPETTLSGQLFTKSNR